MKKRIKVHKDLPFEEGKTYTTKMQTKEKFTITEILYKETKENGVTIKTPRLFMGIYEKCPHLGPCPMYVDRLIPETMEIGEIEVCGKCGEPI